jgi:chitodextrinase
MKIIVGCWALSLVMCCASFAQVDTSFIYNQNTPYGLLDIRIAKSATNYYYLQENKTFSFRETAPGVRTNTYKDMTSWDSSPYQQGNLREKIGTADNFIMNYRLLLPQNYNPSYSAGYPMIVMIHGAGERGNCWDNSCFWDTRAWNPRLNSPAAPTASNHELLNNDYNLLHGGYAHLEARNLAGNRLPGDPALPQRAFPGFVLFPQNLNGWDINNTHDAMRIIRLLSKKYKIDPDKIYVHGLSNGGIGTYEVIKRAPWMFAAALPMSAPHDASINSRGLAPKVAHIPLWIFQGGQDTAPTPIKSRGYVKAFRNAGAIVRYNEYSNLGHGVWNTAYAEPDFFSWMLGINKANIHLFAGVSAICESNGQGVRMELAEGFHAYQWERNGVIIPEATGPNYVASSTGTYRARFSRKKNPSPADWNRWSDPVQVTSQNVAQPEITQAGTVLVPGLDNYGSVNLKAPANFEHYYWYKNGSLLDLPGNMDDTTRHVRFTSGDCSTGICAGNGVYTLTVATADNCSSVPSAGKYLFFSNQAPINIPSPLNFAGTALANGQVSLTWTDQSTDENGFEIWRRRQTGTTFTPWKMAPIVPVNATSFIDQGLAPSSTYQYKIRAVGNAGRSNYTPLAANQYLIVQTTGDTQNPTAPQNVAATATGIREIKLTWNASSDNIGIQEYMIYYGSNVVATGSSATTYKFTNLPLNADFIFTVRAKDLGNNLSAVSNQAPASTYVNGLYYEHTTGAYSDIDLINWNMVEYEGTVDNFTLTPRTQEDYFNFRFEGYLYISKAGSYQFQTNSDDGSRLEINNVVTVDNDGLHGAQTVTGAAMNLAVGGHLINVKYFEYTGNQNLSVRYRGPDTGNNWIDIPDAALRSGNNTTNSLLSVKSASPKKMTAEAVETAPVLPDIYPNPLRPTDDLTMVVPDGNQPVSVKLMDLMGKSYYENTFLEGELSTATQIRPNQQLTKGIYIMVVEHGNKITKQKIIVKE